MQDLYIDLAILTFANTTVCSVSTFCLWPAVAHRPLLNIGRFDAEELLYIRNSERGVEAGRDKNFHFSGTEILSDLKVGLVDKFGYVYVDAGSRYILKGTDLKEDKKVRRETNKVAVAQNNNTLKKVLLKILFFIFQFLYIHFTFLIFL